MSTVNSESTTDLQTRLQRADLLLNTYARLAAIEDLDGIFAELVDIIGQQTNAEYATLFLNDSNRGELYSRVTHGSIKREIRFLNDQGVAGHVFQSGESLLIPNAYESPMFNSRIDESTGVVTRDILAVPIRTTRGEIIGVAEAINHRKSGFTNSDLDLASALTTHASVFLKSGQFVEEMRRSRKQEMDFLDVVSDITSDINLSAVLRKVMSEATRLLDAERSTLFLNDEKTGELWSEVGEGLSAVEIRMPNHVGIAGAVFSSAQTINIPHAYADLRFNPAFDKKTGFFTRSILCVPVVNKANKIIGVTQVLNKRGGVFTHEDESRLKAFTAQISVGLENAKLFNDVQNIKNYNENMLNSMSNGVITLDEDNLIITCNQAGLRMLGVDGPALLRTSAADFFGDANAWVMERIEQVITNKTQEIVMDAELQFGERVLSLNLTVMPLAQAAGDHMGIMLMLEDVTNEKRIKSTMARYVDPSIADQLLASDDLLGGRNTVATALFTDIRGFTTLAEKMGPQETVAMLNAYFTRMVECIQREDGMLDKFIGDAIMAAFGIPLSHGDDEDRAVRSAIDMIRTLHGWNLERGSETRPVIDMGIGLNTDTVVSGNIGSPRRMDYTMIGDGVNLAARLESACKQYGAKILISENTYKKLKGTYRIREIDRVVVKGKTTPVGVFEVLDFHTQTSFPNLMEAVGHFKEGQQHYMQQDWTAAKRAFETAQSLNPNDRLPEIYLERCRHFKTTAPADGWQGEWVMQTK